MVNPIHSEDGKGLSDNIRPLLKSLSLYDRSDGLTEPFHLTFQPSCDANFTQNLQSWGCRSSVFPKSEKKVQLKKFYIFKRDIKTFSLFFQVLLRIIGTVTCSN